jgi:hypothetical protein
MLTADHIGDLAAGSSMRLKERMRQPAILAISRIARVR